PNSDIDLVVEGDAIKLARAMAARFGGHVHAHARFGTAKWMLDQRPVAQDQGAVRSLDFITARREFYTNPTALPQVEHSSIQQDLHRRDFTINTLAICLDELRFGQLLDFFGGLDDLHNGVIRVMHNLSFIEDPTRILRAARYEQRLGFRIEPRTAELMSDALGLFARVSGERLANELFLILAEAEPEKALSRLEEIGALGAIHADLHYSEATGMQMGRLRAALGRVEPLVSVGVLTHHLPLAGALGIAERLRLSKAQTTFIEQLNRLWHLESSLAAHDLAPSQLARSLEPFSPDAQTVAAALTDNLIVRERIERYQTQWRFEKPTTDGLRLQELGLSPGPVYRTILEAIRAARLDGIVSTAAEEEALALKLAAEHTQQDKEK
ncbi:MAG: CCA tRNA nucleotidyltransferase, partial [Chloroflexi bacterium]|nr:CCA tRNA nucleotidyltransferase [Chloroflexota bacterium]